MKKYNGIFLSGLIVLALSCKNNSSVPAKNEDTTEEVEEVVDEPIHVPDITKDFPELYQYLHAKDSSFDGKDFEGGATKAVDSMPPTPIDKSQLSVFYPHFIPNPDSTTLAIDYISYNYLPVKKGDRIVFKSAGPDNEVAIIDFRSNLRKRILFLGSMATVLDARWEPGNKVLVIVAEQGPGNQVIPSIWRYDLNTGNYEHYRYKKPLQVNIGNYAEEKLNEKTPA